MEIKNSNLRGRKFKGAYYPKLKRIISNPRHKIKRLLRAAICFDTIDIKDQESPKVQ